LAADSIVTIVESSASGIAWLAELFYLIAVFSHTAMRNPARTFRSAQERLKAALSAHRAVCIAVTVALGLAAGIFLQHVTQLPGRPRSVSQLIHALQKQNTPFHNLCQDIWICLPDWITSRCGLLRPLGAPEVRANAANELGGLGSAATRAVPFLARALYDPDAGVRSAALRALSDLGPIARTALPTLIDYFNDPANVPIVGFPDLRADIANILMVVAPDDNLVVHTLLTNALAHPDVEFRARLLVALGGAKAPPPAFLNALRSALLSTNQTMRDAAIRSAGQLGPKAAELVPTLIDVYQELSRNTDGARPVGAFSPVIVRRSWSSIPVSPLPAPTNVSAVSSSAPARLGATASSAPTILMARYAFPSVPVDSNYEKSQVIETLGQIGPLARAAVPMLSRDATNSYRAVLARWQIDQDTLVAIAALERFLDAKPPAAVRCSIIESLRCMGSNAVPVITQMLAQSETSVRYSAVLALGRLGPPASAALLQLERLLGNDPKFCIRLGAETALKRIAPARAADWKAVPAAAWLESKEDSSAQ
jgi:HEAT repeat protein